MGASIRVGDADTWIYVWRQDMKISGPGAVVDVLEAGVGLQVSSAFASSLVWNHAYGAPHGHYAPVLLALWHSWRCELV